MLGLRASLAQSHSAILTFHSHVEAPQNTWLDRPGVNSAPQKKLLLTGTKDRRMEVWFYITYVTEAKACQNQTLLARAAGAPEVPQVIYDSVRVPAGETKFSVPLVLDRYIPGRCGWHPSALLHAEFEPDISHGPTFWSGAAAIRPQGRRYVKVTWLCQQTGDYSALEDKTQLACQGIGGYSEESTTVSADGGVVEVDFTLAADHHVP
ncbi:hypothetical protein PSAC2689_10278 [Paraburkholderia sacchari]